MSTLFWLHWVTKFDPDYRLTPPCSPVVAIWYRLGMDHWKAISEHIGLSSGTPFNPETRCGVGGGCINISTLLSDGARTYFVKLNQSSLIGMFEAESQGLEAMASTASIRVPQPLCLGTAGDQAYLVMEYIEMAGAPDPAMAGRQLSAMHRTPADRFGWRRDNTIGSTPQINTWSDDWIGFWRDRRLGFQLRLAADKGHRGRLQKRGGKLLELVPALIDHNPEPSLIHGDLWGGNIAGDREGNPVIFDPAVYYADREADLAMTELFGGFGARFYDAYREAWPLHPGYATRKTLYNLYHILNHLNIFGGGYGRQALGMIDMLLAELGD